MGVATVEIMSDASPELPPDTGTIRLGAAPGRPARTYVTGRITGALRWAALALVWTAVVLTVVRFPGLPETVPTHFGPAGPDSWGPRSSVFVLVGIAVAVTAGIAWLSRHPRSFNYLGTLTEANAQAHYRVGEQLMVWILCCSALIFTGALLSVLFGAGYVAFATVGGIGMIVSIGVGITRMVRIPEKG